MPSLIHLLWMVFGILLQLVSDTADAFLGSARAEPVIEAVVNPAAKVGLWLGLQENQDSLFLVCLLGSLLNPIILALLSLGVNTITCFTILPFHYHSEMRIKRGQLPLALHEDVSKIASAITVLHHNTQRHTHISLELLNPSSSTQFRGHMVSSSLLPCPTG